MALKFYKEKKDPTQKLINFGFKSLLGPVGNAAFNYAKEQMVKNIHPSGYNRPFKKIKDAVLNKNHGGGIEEDWVSGHLKERRDLLSMMMLNKQQHNTIPMSKYRPTSSKNSKNSVYYSSPTTESNIKKRIKERGIESVLSGFQPNKHRVCLRGWVMDQTYGMIKKILIKIKMF